MKKIFTTNSLWRGRQKNRGMTHSMSAQCHPEYSRGMTYVEIIVVLGIFGLLSAIVIFNYGEFQAKVDIKNLTSDIALKVVEAQKSSLSGNLPPRIVSNTWKPSYGLYFSTTSINGVDNKNFIYFTDLDQNGSFNILTGCTSTSECLDKITIVKGNNFISSIVKCDDVSCSIPQNISTPISILFKRPDASPIFSGVSIHGTEYIKITVQSPKTANARINIFASGRVEVN